MKSNNIKKIFSGVLFLIFFSALISVPADFSELGQLSSYFKAQVSGSQSSNATFVFSHNEKEMIAGKDSWLFKLENGKRGDKLTIKAWKDGVPVNSGRDVEICRVRWGTSCNKKGNPSRGDVGTWKEKVYINGVEKGEITIYVKLASVPPKTVKADPYFFKGSTLKINSAVCGDEYGFTIQGYSSSQIWLVQTKNGKPSYDKILNIPHVYKSVCNLDEGTYVNKAYSVVDGKRGDFLGNVTFHVNPTIPLKELSCKTVRDSSNPSKARLSILNGRPGYNYNWNSPTNCSVTNRENNDGQGGSAHWVDVNCQSLDSFSFVATEAATGRFTRCVFDSGKQSCALKINSSVIEAGDSATWSINSVPSGYTYTWLGKNNGKEIEGVPGTSKTNGTEKYTYSEPAIYYRKAVINLPGKTCTTNEVKLEVVPISD